MPRHLAPLLAENLEDEDVARLWAEVVARALRDAVGIGCYCRLERRRALEWLTGGAAVEVLRQLGWSRARARRAIAAWLGSALRDGRL